jgi:hypothetical protein
LVAVSFNLASCAAGGGATLLGVGFTAGAGLPAAPLTEGAGLAVGRTSGGSSPPLHADNSNGTTITALTHRLRIIPTFYHDIDDPSCPIPTDLVPAFG